MDKKKYNHDYFVKNRKKLYQDYNLRYSIKKSEEHNPKYKQDPLVNKLKKADSFEEMLDMITRQA